jgi:hypothetical protein
LSPINLIPSPFLQTNCMAFCGGRTFTEINPNGKKPVPIKINSAHELVVYYDCEASK